MHDIKSCCCCCSEWFTGRSWAVLHVVSRPTVVPPFGPVLTIGSNGCEGGGEGKGGQGAFCTAVQLCLECEAIAEVIILNVELRCVNSILFLKLREDGMGGNMTGVRKLHRSQVSRSVWLLGNLNDDFKDCCVPGSHKIATSEFFLRN